MRRHLRVAGTPYQIGHALGRETGNGLAERIDRYIAEGPNRFAAVVRGRLDRGTMPWFDRLPVRFREEMAGLADGSGVPLRRVAEWTYVEACCGAGCAAFLLRAPGTGETWIGRNNDLWAPEAWGYAIVRDHTTRIPTLSFGMGAETFTATGINRARLWLHNHHLPPVAPSNEAGRFKFVWLTEALETCESLADVEERLIDTPRRGSMLLFAVDGKTDERAAYACEPTSHVRWEDESLWIAGTNHRRTTDRPAAGSLARLERLEIRLAEAARHTTVDAEALRGILADEEIEQARDGYGTVYSNIVCPSSGEIHFTFGGFPAASRGIWAPVEWPWA